MQSGPLVGFGVGCPAPSTRVAQQRCRHARAWRRDEQSRSLGERWFEQQYLRVSLTNTFQSLLGVHDA